MIYINYDMPNRIYIQKTDRLYKGFASVRENIVIMCVQNNFDLVLEFNGKYMGISLEKLKNPAIYKIHRTNVKILKLRIKKMKFEIKKEHLILLKKMYVGWQDCEYGAPEIDPKRPYGNSGVEHDICEILGKIKVDANGEEQYLTKDLKYAGKIHKEMENVLQICLCTQSFKTGIYEKDCEYNSTSWIKK